MANKPETTFIHSVHRHLRGVYIEKMYNPYRSGTPDVWYSGSHKDMWIEYKYITNVPVKSSIKLQLSELQKLWLRDRHAEGRNVAVICGCKQGGVVFTDRDWENPTEPSVFTSRILTRKDVAQWIFDQISERPP